MLSVRKLPHQSRPACAECEAEPDLLLPRGGACQQEVRHVGARDEQDQSHHRHEHEQRLSESVAQDGRPACT